MNEKNIERYVNKVMALNWKKMDCYLKIWEWVFASNWGILCIRASSTVMRMLLRSVVMNGSWTKNFQFLYQCSNSHLNSWDPASKWLESASYRADGFRVLSIEVHLHLCLIKRSQLRWIGRLIRMVPGSLPLEVFQACPTGIKLGIMYPIWPGNTAGSPKGS